MSKKKTSQLDKEDISAVITALFAIALIIVLAIIFFSLLPIILPFIAIFLIQKIPDKYEKTKCILIYISCLFIIILAIFGAAIIFGSKHDVLSGISILFYAAVLWFSPLLCRKLIYGAFLFPKETPQRFTSEDSDVFEQSEGGAGTSIAKDVPSENQASKEHVLNQSIAKNNSGKKGSGTKKSRELSRSAARSQYLSQIYKGFIVPTFFDNENKQDYKDPHNYFEIYANDEVTILKVISTALSSKYSPEFSALGMFNESTYTEGKVNDIICEIIVQAYAESKNPYDMFAVSKAYSKKGKYGEEKHVQYLIAYFDAASAEQQEEVQKKFYFGNVAKNKQELISALISQDRLLDALEYASQLEDESDGSTFEYVRLLGDIYLRLDPVNCVGFYQEIAKSEKYKNFRSEAENELKKANAVVESGELYRSSITPISQKAIDREKNLQLAAKSFVAYALKRTALQTS